MSFLVLTRRLGWSITEAADYELSTAHSDYDYASVTYVVEHELNYGFLGGVD